MLARLKTRDRRSEWMDAPDADPQQLAASLRFIEAINRWLGYTRLTLRYLRRFSRNWPAGEVVTLLDIATGSADVPAAIHGWARRCGMKVKIIGLDLHERTLAVAAQKQVATLLRGDARQLPLANASVDYAITSMFLHHLEEPDAVAVLREMQRVARRGIIVADLLRRRRAYGWIWLLTLGASPMVRHDARASVAGALSVKEMQRLANAAGLEWCRLRTHFGHRFVLAGEQGHGAGAAHEGTPT